MIFFLYPCTDYQDMQNLSCLIKKSREIYNANYFHDSCSVQNRIGKFHLRDSFSWWINVRLRELSSIDNCLHPKVGIFSSKYQKKRVKSNLVFEKFVFMVSYLIFSVTLFFKISKKKIICMLHACPLCLELNMAYLTSNL